jgi:hypothetical protein
MSEPPRTEHVSIFDRWTERARQLRYEVDWTTVTVLTVIGVGAFGMLLLIISLHDYRVLMNP